MQSTPQHVLTATTTTTLLALSGCLAGCDRLPLASSALSQPVPASLQLSIAEDAKRDAAHRKHAVQALLTNLLDDAELPAFSVVDPALVCGEDSTVHVDGRPVESFVRAPLSSFTLDWQLAGMCPLGPDGPRLWGALRMIVVRDDDEGIVPVVYGAALPPARAFN